MKSTFRISWRSRIFSSFTIYLLTTTTTAQNFESDDKLLSNAPVQTEANKPVRVALYNKSEVLDHVARQLVAAQLREMLFAVSRAVAEKEIKDRRNALKLDTTTGSPVPTNLTTTTLRSHSYTRIGRQDDGDEDGDDGDTGTAAAGAGAGAAAAIPSRPTIPPQIGLFPQVANLVRVFFGGNQQSQVNFTNFVGTATKLLPRPLGNQVLGIVKTLANENNGNPISTLNAISGGQLSGLPSSLNQQSGGGLPSLTQEQILALGLPANSPLNPANFKPQNGLEANGITQEQLLALGLPGGGGGGGGFQNGLEANGITQEQLLALGLPIGGGGGIGGGQNPNNGLSQQQQQRPSKPLAGGGSNSNAPSQNQNQELPGGLTIADIQALQALGVPDLPNIEHLLATTRSPPPRSTRKPRPQYTVNKQPNPQRQQAAQQQQLQQLNLEQNQGQSNRFQTLDQNQGQSNRFQNLEQNQAQSNRFQNQGINNQGQSNRFHNLENSNRFQQGQENPNRFQQQQQQQHQQELHYPPTKAPDFLPAYVTRNPQFAAPNKDILPQNLNPSQQSLSQIQQNLQSPQGPKYQETPQSASYPNFQHQSSNSNSHASAGIGNLYGQQNQNYLPQQQVQQQQQQQQPIGGGGLGGFTQQQLQQYQQQLQQQIQQGSYQQNGGIRPSNSFQPQGQPNLQFPQNGFQPNFAQLSQQQQFQLQAITPRPAPKPTTLSPLQHFQNFFRPPTRATTVATNNVDEDESEEDDTDDIDDSRRGRQLNILKTLFPTISTILAHLNNRNNPNNNAQPQQQQQPVQPQDTLQNELPQQPDPQQSTSQPPPQLQNNGTSNSTAPNRNFDLQMFAQNLGKGMGDVIRVMPDLFRGAREGLQLIQALSSIFRAFPGLGDGLIAA